MMLFHQPPLDTPGAPSTPRILKNEPSGVQLSWGKPMEDGGGKIQGYQVEMKEVGTQNWVPANDAITRETNFTVDRMKPNTGQSQFRDCIDNRALTDSKVTGISL